LGDRANPPPARFRMSAPEAKDGETPFRARGDEESVAQVVEIPELQPWFLVHWRSTGHPDVLMEFETRDEAESALLATFAEIAASAGDEVDILPMTVCSALTMFEKPELRDALWRWDAQLAELESRMLRTIQEVYPKRAS
jgi:hypothetical protein